jgi:hypothetical protein
MVQGRMQIQDRGIYYAHVFKSIGKILLFGVPGTSNLCGVAQSTGGSMLRQKQAW